MTAVRLALLVAVALSPLHALTPSSAQEPDRAFKLRWFGQSFFQLETPAGKRVVFDPHAIPEFDRVSVPADVVLLSHLHDDHTRLGSVADAKAARVFYGLEPAKKGRAADWNKVDEKVGPVRVRAVPLFHDAREGLERGKNAAWVVEADGLTVCHLGDLGHELAPAQVRAIGPVDVLMVPVGGIYTLNGAQAKAVVDQVKPRLYALPMHYGVPGYDDLLPADEFLDGQPQVKRQTDTNELVIPAGAKADRYTVVVLGWRKGK